MCIFPFGMEKRESNAGLPSWHRKSQRAYRINRIIILLQIVAAFVLCGVVWFGVDKVLH